MNSAMSRINDCTAWTVPLGQELSDFQDYLATSVPCLIEFVRISSFGQRKHLFDYRLDVSRIDHVHAAAIPVAAVTARRALFDTAGLKKDQKVLIHGAAGGVGSFAVQLAKWKGAHVMGTGSSRNQAFLRELGVDEPIDYEKTRFEDVLHDVNVVLDPIGGDTQKRSWKVLKKGGILVSIVAPPSADEAAKHGVRSAFLSAQGGSSLLAELAKLWSIDFGLSAVSVSFTTTYSA